MRFGVIDIKKKILHLTEKEIESFTEKTKGKDSAFENVFQSFFRFNFHVVEVFLREKMLYKIFLEIYSRMIQLSFCHLPKVNVVFLECRNMKISWDKVIVDVGNPTMTS